ncbi:MAG TPA: 7-cyano-7-deazaguanine synthase, partial [Pyrinomonadaceae bacterium]
MGGTQELATEVLESVERDNSQLAICLVSGGMDSCVTAAIAHEENDELAFLHVGYGQRTEKRERESFQAIADYFGVDSRLVISLEHLAQIGGSSLTDSTIPVTAANLTAPG